ncbi:MAG TPA: protease pro-enzyme activation domain-containing protein, partial [Ktedonobacteraceae bacterium]|nr:protease pro-enzyme activation domain-containing protein [Ktedonobacteraceae bacterium]
MKLTLVRKFAITLVAFIIISISVSSFALIGKASQNSPYVLTNQTVPLVSHAHLVGEANSQQQLNLSIGLQLRDQQGLQTLLTEMYTPHSPIYHHFLSPQQFVNEFGPTVEQQQQVINYLQQQGFHITHIASNRLLIDASASVNQAEAAFKVSINNYKMGANVFYANANSPTIPGPLASIISSIGGLDNSVHMRPLYHLIQHSSHTAKAGPDGGYAPADLNGAYDATPLLQSGVQGANQTVAVFELDGYQSSDVTQYFQTYNLGSPSISNVLVDGFDGSAGAGAIEVELDIEV